MMPTLIRFAKFTPVRWLLAFSWTLWLTIILIQPEARPVIDIGVRPAPPSLEREIVFTTGHVVGFALMTGLWWWALVERLSLTRALVAAMLVAFGVGTFSELMQTQTLDRHPSLIDFAANGVGAAVFAWLLMRWTRNSGRPSSRRTPAN